MSEMNPPKAAEAVVRQFLREQEIEPVTGDLLEEYRAGQTPCRSGSMARMCGMPFRFSALSDASYGLESWPSSGCEFYPFPSHRAGTRASCPHQGPPSSMR